MADSGPLYLDLSTKSSSMFLFFLILFQYISAPAAQRTGIEILLDMKSVLDPNGLVLESWVQGVDPCGGDFVGVACDEEGRITNISLQGRGLTGTIPPCIGELENLTGLYLHYNDLIGTIPGPALANLSSLSDLYLNVNSLEGNIPPEVGNLSSLQALQLCCNKLNGSIPEELGQLSQLNLLALQHNELNGTIPASLGNLTNLKHLDVSSNMLTGPIPSALSNLTQITVLDVHGNNLTGTVPPGMHLVPQFIYSNNSGLCGDDFTGLHSCATGPSLQRPEPLGALSPSKEIPPMPSQPKSISANTGPNIIPKTRPKSSHMSQVAVIAGVIAVAAGVSLAALFSFVWFRRHKQKISSTFEGGERLEPSVNGDKRSDCSGGTAYQNASTSTTKTSLASLAGVQPAVSPKGMITCSLRNYRLDELELATNFFSEKNLFTRKNYVSIYKAVLRDGSSVVVKNFTKVNTMIAEKQMEATLECLTLLRHENVVRLKGFCCPNGGEQCYLVYDYISNGTLFDHLHGGTVSPLDWPARVHISHNVAKGLEYLHQNMEQVVVWSSNILLDENYNALISSYGIHKILADEMLFSTVKTSAMLGYLAPEYTAVGHLTQKSDVYAFGMLLLEILTGQKPLHADASRHGTTNLANAVRPLFQSGQLQEIIDPALRSKFSAAGAMGIASIAFACINEDVEERPPMSHVVQRLKEIEAMADAGVDGGFSSSGEEYQTIQQAAYVEMLDYGR